MAETPDGKTEPVSREQWAMPWCWCGAFDPKSARYGHSHLTWCGAARYVGTTPSPAPDLSALWQPIAGWSDYEVNRLGVVRKTTGEIVGQWLNSQGYLLARLSNPRRMVRVHRLVAETFIENPDGRPFVNHINNVRHDNRVENLEWCSQAENLAHADKQGRMRRDYWRGKRSPNAKLTTAEVLSIRAAWAANEGSWEALGVRFGLSKRAIGRLVSRETYRDV